MKLKEAIEIIEEGSVLDWAKSKAGKLRKIVNAKALYAKFLKKHPEVAKQVQAIVAGKQSLGESLDEAASGLKKLVLIGVLLATAAGAFGSTVMPVKRSSTITGQGNTFISQSIINMHVSQITEFKQFLAGKAAAFINRHKDANADDFGTVIDFLLQRGELKDLGVKFVDAEGNFKNVNTLEDVKGLTPGGFIVMDKATPGTGNLSPEAQETFKQLIPQMNFGG